MGTISSLISKLNLLGDDTLQLSKNAMIATSKARDEVVCYNIKNGEVLSKVYDRLVPSDYSLIKETKYLVGIKGSNRDILDSNLVIKSKYYDEEISEIIDNQYVIVFRPLSSTYRVTTIEGKELTIGVSSNIKIYRASNQVICVCYQADNKSYILRLENGEVVSKTHTNEVNKIYIGIESIALRDSDECIQVYGKDNKLKLSVKNGKVQQITEDFKPVYRVYDQYGYNVTEFEYAEIIY